MQPRSAADGRDPSVAERIADFGRRVEQLGFSGLWLTDSLGRGWATLDPLIDLAALSSVTRKIELGTCVLQVPLRNPVELAHRVQSLNVLTGGRLTLGVGAGSTRDDFDALGLDYEARFKTLPASLDIMRRAWRGEPVHGPALSLWPGTEGGPPVLLGAWRSQRWISLAADTCQGWMASGIHTKWEDLELGIAMYRKAGGKRVAIANVFTDMRPKPELTPMIEHSRINLICTPAEAKQRLKRLQDLGVDDALLVPPFGAPDQMEAIRGLL